MGFSFCSETGQPEGGWGPKDLGVRQGNLCPLRRSSHSRAFQTSISPCHAPNNPRSLADDSVPTHQAAAGLAGPSLPKPCRGLTFPRQLSPAAVPVLQGENGALGPATFSTSKTALRQGWALAYQRPEDPGGHTSSLPRISIQIFHLFIYLTGFGYEVHVVLELMETFLPQPLEFWDYTHVPDSSILKSNTS